MTSTANPCTSFQVPETCSPYTRIGHPFCRVLLARKYSVAKSAGFTSVGTLKKTMRCDPVLDPEPFCLVAPPPTTAPARHSNTCMMPASCFACAATLVSAWNSASPVERARSDCVDAVTSREQRLKTMAVPVVERIPVSLCLVEAKCCRWQLWVSKHHTSLWCCRRYMRSGFATDRNGGDPWKCVVPIQPLPARACHVHTKVHRACLCHSATCPLFLACRHHLLTTTGAFREVEP